MNYRLLACMVICVFLAGCADVGVPGPDEILRQPLGRGGLHAGMKMAQVIERYGEPDIRGRVLSEEWKGYREEWVYRGRYSIMPVSAGYLSEDLYLYFDGDSLTHISKRPLGGDTENAVEEYLK